ncbi:MAG: nucleotidyltransferase domain-containing protein [Gammaproteobacteria bacterium]|nr:nucleotidyltransferase domain-containing protein [Gammaproteobacteria bacterium]MCY4210005.1 nucleotidyltransferase domain-containing protein [Gammaproteobacteria bacterium]
MNINEINENSRRILIDVAQLYEAYLAVDSEFRSYRGSMRWKKVNGKEYLFRQRNSRGDGKSLGARDAHTQEIYDNFHARKAELGERRKSLLDRLTQQRGFCIAAGINRVPKIAADVARSIRLVKTGSHPLIVVGTSALFAYENMAGVHLEPALLASEDIDLMWDVKRKLNLAVVEPVGGLLSLLKKADRTFERMPNAPYRAANAKGYMVDLIKPAPAQSHKTTRVSFTGHKHDLVAVEIHNLDWLYAAPVVSATVIGNDGLPVVFDVPDPRVFAAHKLWLSALPNRSPVKKVRDRRQGIVMLQLLKAYLHDYPPDSDALRGLPQSLRDNLQSEFDRVVIEPQKQTPIPAPGF